MKSIVVSMNRSEKIYNAKPYSPLKADIKAFLKRYGILSFFITLLFLGMILGVVRAGQTSGEIMNGIYVFFSGGMIPSETASPVVSFADSFSVSFLFLAVLFCLSLSAPGVVLIPGVIFFRGYEYGIISGYLCVTYGLKGLVYYIAVILSGAFISSMALIYASQYCIDFSLSVLYTFFGKSTTDGQPLRSKFGELTLNCCYMLIVISFASLTDVLLQRLLGIFF